MQTNERKLSMKITNTLENFQLKEQFKKDGNQNKIDLIFIDYVDENEQATKVFPVVKMVENILASDELLRKSYLPALGMDAFNRAAIKLLLGNENLAVKENRVFAIHTVSQTTGLRVAGEFLKKVLGYNIIYNTTPTWENYKYIFKTIGYEVRNHRYWSCEEKKLNIDWMLEDLEQAPENSVVLLQVSGHNPTGLDPNQDEWKKIAQVIERKKLFPLFDSPFQGLVSGDFDKDAWPVRYFVSCRIEFFCTYSMTKLFSMRQERACCLVVVVNNTNSIINIQSQFMPITKSIYWCPPSHGALVVTFILNQPQFYVKWKKELRRVYEEMVEMRKSLRNTLEQLQTPGSWVHVTEQKGVFCLLGISQEQVDYMREKHHVYLMTNGRMCLAGVDCDNVGYIGSAIHDAIINIK